MTIEKIQSVYLATKDMGAAQRFYEEALGLKVKFSDPSKWTQFAVGATSFALSSAQEAAPGAAGAVVVFESSSLQGVAERVAAAGGRLLQTRDMGSHGQVLTFSDIEGNIFQVFSKASAT